MDEPRGISQEQFDQIRLDHEMSFELLKFSTRMREFNSLHNLKGAGIQMAVWIGFFVFRLFAPYDWWLWIFGINIAAIIPVIIWWNRKGSKKRQAIKDDASKRMAHIIAEFTPDVREEDVHIELVQNIRRVEKDKKQARKSFLSRRPGI